MDDAPAALRQAALWLREATSLLITAGAGMGVDSGLPDFRGPRGLWHAYPALAEVNWAFHEIASPAAFHARPALAWSFYAHRLDSYRKTQPHAGFDILRRWAERMPDDYRVFTSNVDGQFQKAGFDPGKIVECHGSIHRLQCLEPCGHDTWSAEHFQPELDHEKRLVSPPPLCPRCGALARPHILMFNDDGWHAEATMARWDQLETWARARARSLLVIELGAGKAIPTARALGERHAHRLIRINPREAGVPSGSRRLGIEGTALATLRRIDTLQ